MTLVPSDPKTEAEVLLVAADRTPNSDRLDVDAAGIEVGLHGHARTDGTYQTNVPGIWALGDVANHSSSSTWPTPRPASCGTTCCSRAARCGHSCQSFRPRYSLTPRSPRSAPQGKNCRSRNGTTSQPPITTAMPPTAGSLEDTTSFVKVLADPSTRLLLGAHIIRPQASAIIQPRIQAMCLGSTADEVASGVLYIHPALTEATEQALLEL
jgi:mycothione reductase